MKFILDVQLTFDRHENSFYIKMLNVILMRHYCKLSKFSLKSPCRLCENQIIKTPKSERTRKFGRFFGRYFG